MKLGYDRALYLLPFDHRQSYVKDMFHLDPPLTAPQVITAWLELTAARAQRS